MLPLPPPNVLRTFPVSSHLQSASLWQNLPAPVRSRRLLTMEDLGQSYGYILYRTALAPGPSRTLTIAGLHDYAQIYIDHRLISSLDRRINTSRLSLPPVAAPSTLDILVENSGRVNYTSVIRTERKGITGSVTIGSAHPAQWQIYSLPMDHLARLKFRSQPCNGPCFFRTTMQIDSPAATYLDTSHLRKGEVWINGRALGRFWFIGPQFALYTPSSWLISGRNKIVFFDLQGSAADAISTVTHPSWAQKLPQQN